MQSKLSKGTENQIRHAPSKTSGPKLLCKMMSQINKN